MGSLLWVIFRVDWSRNIVGNRLRFVTFSSVFSVWFVGYLGWESVNFCFGVAFVLDVRGLEVSVEFLGVGTGR